MTSQAKIQMTEFHEMKPQGKVLLPRPLPLEALYHKYGIERSHADNVARNVLELFDVLAPVHGLGPEFRKLVEIAALVHDSGVATDMENHHKAGRDILLLHPPANLPEKLWQVVAWTAFLHKKKIGKKRSSISLTKKSLEICLKISRPLP